MARGSVATTAFYENYTNIFRKQSILMMIIYTSFIWEEIHETDHTPFKKTLS